MALHPRTARSRPILNKVKNSLQYYNRYVSILLVTGSLPNLPNKLSNALPDLETLSLREVKQHLSTRHSARRAFMKVEFSEKTKRAIPHPIRSCKKIFARSYEVYYTNEESRRSGGPGRVLGHLGLVVQLFM